MTDPFIVFKADSVELHIEEGDDSEAALAAMQTFARIAQNAEWVEDETTEPARLN